MAWWALLFYLARRRRQGHHLSRREVKHGLRDSTAPNATITGHVSERLDRLSGLMAATTAKSCFPSTTNNMHSMHVAAVQVRVLDKTKEGVDNVHDRACAVTCNCPSPSLFCVGFGLVWAGIYAAPRHVCPAATDLQLRRGVERRAGGLRVAAVAVAGSGAEAQAGVGHA